MGLVQQIVMLEATILIVICLFWIALYLWLRAGSRRAPPPLDRLPSVTVVVPAHDEEEGIARTVQHILDADYPGKRVVVVDDGSMDGTARELARFGDRITVVTHARNQGKAAALNRAIAESGSEIVVTVDADSLIAPDSLRNIVRHFADPRVAAVAGFVKVHNNDSLFRRIQDLEYIQCLFQREVQDMLNAVTITPGPLSAYRRDVLVSLGGFKDDTLVEDFDMCIRIHRLGHEVRSDSDSVVRTVAPDIPGWWRQRTRWFRGGIQLLRKHSDIVFNQDYSFLGMVMFPLAIFWLFVPVIAVPTLLLNSLPEREAVDLSLSILISEGFTAMVRHEAALFTSGLLTVGKLTLFRAVAFASTVTGLAYVYLAVRVSRESLASYLLVLPLIGLYSCMLLTVCLKSVLQEVLAPNGREW